MHRQARTVQLFGVGLVVAVILVGTLRALGPGNNGSNNRPSPGPPYVFRLIRQEAAYPGKVIEAEVNGTPLPPYKCTADDAAIAICTMVNPTTGANQTPSVLRAVDAENHGYVAKVLPDGPAWIIRLQSGFSTLPGSIAVTLGGNFAVPSPLPTNPASGPAFQFSKIATPKRVLAPLSPAQAAAAAKIGTVTVNDRTGTTSIRSVVPDSSTSYTIPQVVGTSFAADDPLRTGITSLSDYYSYYGRGIDTLKVRFDRFKYVEAEATLTYLNAKIVKVKDVGVLMLPSQDVGTVFGLRATVTNAAVHPKPKWVRGSPISTGEIVVQLSPTSNATRDAGTGRPTSGLILMDITPSPKTMGLQTLHLWVLSKDPYLMGLDRSIENPEGTNAATLSIIPKLTIRLRKRTAYPDSTVTVILPVKHVSEGRRNSMMPHPAFNGGDNMRISK